MESPCVGCGPLLTGEREGANRGKDATPHLHSNTCLSVGMAPWVLRSSHGAIVV